MSYRVYNQTTGGQKTVQAGESADLQVSINDKLYFSGSGWTPYTAIELQGNGQYIDYAQSDASGGWMYGPVTVTSVNDMVTRAVDDTHISGTIKLTSATQMVSVTVAASGPGTTTPYGTQNYVAGSTIPIKAYPDSGYYFIRWELLHNGVLYQQNWPASVNVIAEAGDVYTAIFASPVRLTMNIIGGGYVNVNPDYTSHLYVPGQTVILVANPNAGYVFTGWSGDLSGSVNPTQIIMNTNKTITATFTQNKYQLTLNKSGTGSGSFTVIPETLSGGYRVYDNGTSVSVQANPGQGSVFSGWSGAIGGTINPGTVLMDSNKTATATFTLISPTLTIVVSPASGGVVTKSPNKSMYDYNEPVTLAATPASGYLFAGWSGDASGNINPLTIIMDSNKVISALFTLGNQYAVLLVIVGKGKVAASPPEGVYNPNTSVTLTATPEPDSGYKFTGWSGDVVSKYNPETIIVTKNMSITATFTKGGIDPMIIAGVGVVGVAGYLLLKK